MPTPEVTTRTLTPEDKFLIMASDGVWECAAPCNCDPPFVANMQPLCTIPAIVDPPSDCGRPATVTRHQQVCVIHPSRVPHSATTPHPAPVPHGAVGRFIDNAEAVTIVDRFYSNGQPAIEASRFLIARAALAWRKFEGEYRDDITAIVLYLPSGAPRPVHPHLPTDGECVGIPSLCSASHSCLCLNPTARSRLGAGA